MRPADSCRRPSSIRTFTWMRRCRSGQPRLNQSGTLREGIALWGELKPLLTQEALVERALRYCDLAVAQGLLAIRSHVDVSDPRLLTVEALLEVRARVEPYLDLQLVAFPQDGYLRAPIAAESLERALAMGVDVVGGIPHFERTMADGAASVSTLYRIAAERGLPVDLHCDETDDPLSRHIETLAAETVRHGLQGRVVGSHCTSMHSMDNDYASKLIALIAEARVTVVANPLINITLQGRHDTYPRRRGLTRIPELRAAGVAVALGHDCVMDPWYPLGNADMLEVAHMAIHAGADDVTRRHAAGVRPGDHRSRPRHRSRGLRAQPRQSRRFRPAAGRRSDRGHPPQGRPPSRGAPWPRDRPTASRGAPRCPSRTARTSWIRRAMRHGSGLDRTPTCRRIASAHQPTLTPFQKAMRSRIFSALDLGSW